MANSLSTNLAIQLQEFRKRQKEISERTVKDAKKPKPTPAAKKEPKSGPQGELKYDPKAAQRRGGPLLALQKKVVDCLFHAQKALTPDEINAACGVDVVSDRQLFETLQQNKKVTYSAEDHHFTYKTSHAIKDKEQMFDFLLKYPEGCLINELRDAYPGATEDLDALKKEDKAWMLVNSKSTEVIVFPIDPKVHMKVDRPVSARWHDVGTRVPKDPKDLDATLRAAKLVVMPKSAARRRPPDMREKKKKKREAQFRKVTNEHMPELFSSKDYAPPEQGF